MVLSVTKTMIYCRANHPRTIDVFNIKHLSQCLVDADMNLRVSSFQPGEIDVEGSKFDDAELTDSVLIALDYLEKANQCK